MEGNNQVIRQDMKVKCLKRDADDSEFEGVITHVHEDKQYVDVRGGFLSLLIRHGVPIRFIEVL